MNKRKITAAVVALFTLSIWWTNTNEVVNETNDPSISNWMDSNVKYMEIEIPGGE